MVGIPSPGERSPRAAHLVSKRLETAAEEHRLEVFYIHIVLQEGCRLLMLFLEQGQQNELTVNWAELSAEAVTIPAGSAKAIAARHL